MTGTDPLEECLQGRMTADLAIARLLLAGATAEDIARQVFAIRQSGPAWAALARAAADRPALDRMRAMLDIAGVDHAGTTTAEAIARLFDRAVDVSPEAAVALYSLGDAERLAAVTQDIVAWLEREALLAPGMDMLDLGCGIGRMAAAVAGTTRSVLGLDVSARMIQEARRRCAGLDTVRFLHTNGQDLAAVPDHAFDLVLAVDSFPYLMQAGLAERHVADAARVLRAGGVLVILNLSYRCDAQADQTDAQTWARRYLFVMDQCGTTPFRLWDGQAFVLRRVAQG